MIGILVGTAVSLAILGFAGAVIASEVARHWASIRAALQGAPARIDFAPAGAPQRAAIVPVRAPRRVQPQPRRQPLALAA